jgi:3-deoxy-D-manno-octulosonic acid kinase
MQYSFGCRPGQKSQKRLDFDARLLNRLGDVTRVLHSSRPRFPVIRTHIHFDPQRWKLAPDELFPETGDGRPQDIGGRGKVVFFSRCGIELVRKRYQRGGWARRLVHDRYFFTGLHRTRMWREYHLLQNLRRLGLPVPEPVAVRCVRPCPFTYSGDLVTVRLPGAESLGSVLRREPLPAETWARIGTILGGFHRHGVFHADLNIENIMLDRSSGVALLDFDKGCIRPRGRQNWIRRNMQRLLRSLSKAANRDPVFHFSADDWRTLCAHHARALRDA